MYERRWKDNNLKYSRGNERKLKSNGESSVFDQYTGTMSISFELSVQTVFHVALFLSFFARSYQCVKLRLDIKASENPSSCITEKIHLINLHLHWAENNSLPAEPGWKSQENIKPFSRGSRRREKNRKKLKVINFHRGR